MRNGNTYARKPIRMAAILALLLSLLAGMAPAGSGASAAQAANAANGANAANAAGTIEQEPYEWSNVPIGGGGYVTGMVVHPGEPGLAYIRTDVGGLYRWNEADKSWKQLVGFADRSQINLYGVDSIAIDPNDPEVLYAALGKYDYWTPSDIYKSSDRGETWIRTGLAADGADVPMNANGNMRTVERIAVDPNDSRTVYFGSRTKGLFRSDAAARPGTWSRVVTFPALSDTSKSGITFVAFDPTSGSLGGKSQTVYAGAYNAGVYVSRDAGATWSLMPGSPSKPIRAAVDPAGKMYVTHGAGLAKLEDGRWTDITPAADAGQIFGAVSIDPANPDVLMTARKKDDHGNPIYRSADGGAHWTVMPYSRNILTPWMPDWHWSSATSSIVIDPFDSKRVWLTDWYYAWRTEDITAAPPVWTNDARGLETTVNVSNLVSPPGGGTLLHSGIADNGGFDHRSLTEFPRSTYFTGNGAISMLTTTGIDVQESDPRYVVRVGTYGWNGDSRADPGNGGYSTDGGDTYTAFSSLPYKGAQGGKTAVSATDPDHIVWVPQRGDVYYTLDRGATWAKGVGAPSGLLSGSDIFGNYYQPLASDKVNGHSFYLYDKSGRFYRSTNGGISWMQVSSLPAQGNAWHTVQAAPGVMGEVWVSLNDQGLYRSSDAGYTFTKVAGVQQAFLFSFGKHAPGRLNPSVFVYGRIAGYDKEADFRSDDMGRTWVKISVEEPFPGNDPNAMTGDRQVHGRVYIGTNGTGLLYGARTEAAVPPSYDDTAKPDAPAGLAAAGTGRTYVDLKWEPAVDNGSSGVMGYRVSYADGTRIADTYGTSYSVAGLAQETGYSFMVQTLDYAGNVSDPSAVAAAVTSGSDTVPPAAPSGFRAAGSAAYRIQLEWLPNAEPDVLGYNLYRGVVPGFIPSEANRIASLLTSADYADWNRIEEGKTYYYRLEAVDISRNVSPMSGEIAVTVPADDRLDLIVDNKDAGFSSTGGWISSTFSASRFGPDYVHDGNVAGKTAKWTPYITEAGDYNVYMLWNASANRGYNLPLEIAYDGGVDTTKKVHQNANDNMWVYIGRYAFASEAGHYVKLTSNGTNTAIADAVKFSRASTDPYGATHSAGAAETDSKPPVIKLDQANGTVYAASCIVSGRTNEEVKLTVKVNGKAVETPYAVHYVNVFRLDVPLEEGTNLITVEAADRSGNRSAAELQVVAPPRIAVAGVTLHTYGAPDTMRIGDAYQLTASVLPEGAGNKTVRFAVDHPQAASVTEVTYDPALGTTSALVTALGAGSVTVTATSEEGGYTDAYRFTVTAPEGNGTPPGEVSGVQVVPGDGQLLILWKDPTDKDLARIRLVREGEGADVPVTVTGAVYAEAGAGRALLSGLANGVAYTYRVTAWDTSGNGSAGIVVTGTPYASSGSGSDDGEGGPAPDSGAAGPGGHPPQPSPGAGVYTVERGKVAVTLPVEAVGDGGLAAVAVDPEHLEKAVRQSDDGAVAIEIRHSSKARSVVVDIPMQPLFADRGSRTGSVRVDMGFAAVVIPMDTVVPSGASAAPPSVLQLTAVRSETGDWPAEAQAKLAGSAVYELRLRLDGKAVAAAARNGGGSGIRAEIAYTPKAGERPGKIVVYAVDAIGITVPVPSGRFDPTAGKAVFKLQDFGVYAAAYDGSVPFRDLDDAPWAADAIEALAVRGAVMGAFEGLFHPEGTVTRAEFLAMLMRTFELAGGRREAASAEAGAPVAAKPFPDVKKGDWHFDTVTSAVELGIVQGKADGSFGSGDPVTRQDMAVMAHRLAVRVDAAQRSAAGAAGLGEPAFTDMAAVADYASDAVAAMRRAGVLNGLADGSFAPAGAATRAQAAAMVYRLYILLNGTGF